MLVVSISLMVILHFLTGGVVEGFKCVQCNGTGVNQCEINTNITSCQGNETLCSANLTQIFYSNGTLVNRTVNRGCSLSTVNDGCMTTIWENGTIELTCTSSCKEKEGCNTYTPLDDDPVQDCFECSGHNCMPSVSLPKIRCPRDQTNCYSQMEYLWLQSIGNRNADFNLILLERGCTNDTFKTKCSDVKFGNSSLVHTMCNETCQTDRCNDGWPARPKCVQCSSDPSSVAGGSDSCLYNPPEAEECPQPYEQYCYYTDTGKKENSISSVLSTDNRSGYSRSIVRGCSAVDFGNGCTTFQIGNQIFEQCNKTCETDGCNQGMSGMNNQGSPRPFGSLTNLCISLLVMLAFVH